MGLRIGVVAVDGEVGVEEGVGEVEVEAEAGNTKQQNRESKLAKIFSSVVLLELNRISIVSSRE